jgi:hypothetical protein
MCFKEEKIELIQIMYILHSRTVHLDIIRFFYLPSDAQESFFKIIKIYLLKKLKFTF